MRRNTPPGGWNMKTPYPAARAAPRRCGNGWPCIFTTRGKCSSTNLGPCVRPCPDCLRNARWKGTPPPRLRGERLLNYLESLRRVEPSLKRDQIHSFPALSHIHPDYAAHPPAVDMERLKKARAAAVMEKGRGVYLSKCAICHGNDGMGDKVTYPPLAGSEWLKEKPDVEIVRIILQGLTGPITVNGKEWDSTMLPPGVTDSRDLANLLTFLRRQFGGVEKAAYTPEQVDAIRRDL